MEFLQFSNKNSKTFCFLKVGSLVPLVPSRLSVSYKYIREKSGRRKQESGRASLVPRLSPARASLALCQEIRLGRVRFVRMYESLTRKVRYLLCYFFLRNIMYSPHSRTNVQWNCSNEQCDKLRTASSVQSLNGVNH